MSNAQIASYIRNVRLFLDNKGQIDRYAFFTWSDGCMGAPALDMVRCQDY